MIALVLALSLAQAAAGYTPEEAKALFAEANDAYYKQDYAAAEEKYERLLKAGLGGKDVLFNLGTTYLAAGDLGHAVLDLERAKKLSRDDDIEANLALARQKQGDQVVGAENEAPFLQRLAEAMDEHVVSIAFLVVWFAAFALFWTTVRTEPGKRLGLTLATLVAFAFSLGLGGAVAAHAWVAQTVQEGVVMTPTVKVREFPGENARVAFEVHGGLKVRIMEESGRFLRVRLPNALEGWTEKEGVEAL